MIELVDRTVEEDMPVLAVGMELVLHDVVAVEQLVQLGMRSDRKSLVLLTILLIRNPGNVVGYHNVVVVAVAGVDSVSSPPPIPALVDHKIARVKEEVAEADIVVVAVVDCSRLFGIQILNPMLDSLKFLCLNLQLDLSEKKVDRTLAGA